MAKRRSYTPDFSLDTALLADLLREGVEAGKRPRLTVVSNSMSPLLRVGDQVEVVNVDIEALVPGNIIVLEESHGTLTHRYWQTLSHNDDQYLLTRGDRIPAYDAPHESSALIGLVAARVRGNELLPLDNSKGNRLNQRLAKLARLENRTFANGQPLDQWETISLPNTRVLGEQWHPFARRMLRWILRRYSEFVVLLATR